MRSEALASRDLQTRFTLSRVNWLVAGPTKRELFHHSRVFTNQSRNRFHATGSVKRLV